MRHAAALATAAGFLAGQAAAQEAITADEVTEFLSGLDARAEEAVAAGDWSSVRDWMRGHLSEDARLATSGSIATRDGPMARYSMTLDRETLERLSEAGMAAPGRLAMEAIVDYRLRTEVRGVMELPNGEAGVRVDFHEAGRLGEADGGPLPGLTFHSVSSCDLRLARGGEGALEIVIATCETVTTL
jgi:hypothetical protein